MFLKAEERAFTYIIYSAALAIVLIAGLWPFDFYPRNKVSWLKGRNGVQFDGRGMVFGAIDPAGQPITIELLIQSFVESNDSLPYYLAVLDEKSNEQFFIGQWKSELVLKSGRREIGVRKVFSGGKEQLLTITSRDAGTSIYLNGSPATISSRFFLFPPDKTGRVTLLLGTSPNGKTGLKGIISGLSIYSRALSPRQVRLSYDSWKKHGRTHMGKEDGLAALYLFDERAGNTVRNHMKSGEALAIPETFRPLHREILSFGWNRFSLTRSFLSDVSINIVGFFIFSLIQGVVFLSVLRTRRGYALLLTLISCSALSMLIELAQVYLPSRNSDFTDWICNTLGSLAAVILLKRLPRIPRINAKPVIRNS